MSRIFTASLAAALLLSTAASVAAEDNTASANAPDTTIAAATAPVLDSWAYERPASSPALKTLLGSYTVLQGLDVYSTMVARQAGAREANPVMDGNIGQALAVKAVTGALTYYAAHKMAKKNRKGAVITMAILNGVTAAIVANNMKNARR